MKLACAAPLAPGEDFAAKLANLERLGYEGIDVYFSEPELTPERIAEFERDLEVSPMEIGCLLVSSRVYGVPFDSKEALQTKLADSKLALDTAARLGGVVLVSPEYRPQHPLPLWHRPKPILEREKASALLLAFLDQVAEHAERVSVTAVLEPINRYETSFYHSLEDVMAVCDRVGSERVKIVADFFHMQIEERDIAASIERAAGYIHHVQLGDSNRELPGQGHIDFRSGFAALRRTGYDGYLALECRIPRDPERELAQCAQWLRQQM
jgi:sugar phosphate isomerase/epimerase